MLAESVAEVQALEQTDAERLDALARLLDDALKYHARHPQDQTCPVCGATDRLDAGWSIRAQGDVQQLQDNSAALRGARGREEAARRAIASLFASGIPVALRGAPDAGIDAGAAQNAWDAWAAALADGAPDAVAS